jgi:hypothetical protein
MGSLKWRGLGGRGSVGGGDKRVCKIKHTCILVVELEEISFLVQLVGVAVEEGKDGLKLRNRVLCDIHDGRLVCQDHRRGS